MADLLPDAFMIIDASDLFAGAVSVAGTFLGAWLAFAYQRRLEARQRDSDNIAAGNRALVVLSQQINGLKLMQIDFIDPYRAHPGKHIIMPPIMDEGEEPMRFNVAELDFLLDSGHFKVLMNLLLEEKKYNSVMAVARTRSRHHYDVVQPKIEAAGIREGGLYGADDFKEAVGERDYNHLQRITEALIIKIDEAVPSLLVAKDALRSALKSIYPTKKFLDIEVLDDPPPRTLPDHHNAPGRQGTDAPQPGGSDAR